MQKGYSVILKDNFEEGLAKGYEYINKGCVYIYSVYTTHYYLHLF